MAVMQAYISKLENETRNPSVNLLKRLADGMGMAILHELKDEGRTVIVITHDNEIAEEAERVIRIRDGKVVEDYINPGYEEKYGRESKKNNKNPIDEG